MVKKLLENKLFLVGLGVAAGVIYSKKVAAKCSCSDLDSDSDEDMKNYVGISGREIIRRPMYKAGDTMIDQHGHCFTMNKAGKWYSGC